MVILHDAIKTFRMGFCGLFWKKRRKTYFISKHPKTRIKNTAGMFVFEKRWRSKTNVQCVRLTKTKLVCAIYQNL